MLNIFKKYVIEKKSIKAVESILVLGDPRSGSTWLVETIANIKKSCIIDEPLHLGNDERLRKMNYGWRQHIPKLSPHLESKNFFTNLFNGRELLPIVLHKNTLFNCLRSKNLVFKIIRGKMLLPYLIENFQFKYKPIFLLRHPLAVLHSMKLHSAWSFEFTRFTLPNTIHNEIYSKHFEFLHSLETQEELMLSFWCLSNQEIFSDQELKDKCDVVFYEDLICDTRKVLSQLSCLNRVQFVERDFASPSKTVGSSFKEDKLEQLSKWKSYFKDHELDSYQVILDYFDISVYHTLSSKALPS